MALLIMAVVSMNIFGYNYSYSQSNFNPDTVKAGKFDNGTMWTFDHPPKAYFQETYGFNASDEWLNHVRMSALRFANYCSASFISADGLVMTNHHCGRESVSQVQKPEEDLHKTGFVATNLEDERPVPGLYVDQLVSITDVTKDVQSAIDAGKDDAEKIKNRDEKIKQLEEVKSDNERLMHISVMLMLIGLGFDPSRRGLDMNVDAKKIRNFIRKMDDLGAAQMADLFITRQTILRDGRDPRDDTGFIEKLTNIFSDPSLDEDETD